MKRKVETNLVDNSNLANLTHLDITDFFEDIEGKSDHLISDGNGHIN